MAAIESIDHGIKRFVFSLFWFFVNPLDKERVFGELLDRLERNLNTTNSEHVLAPDSYEVVVNNQVYIGQAHGIARLEKALQERLQKHIADSDYHTILPRVALHILSSATQPKRKIDIRCWFSSEDDDAGAPESAAAYRLEVVDGEGIGLSWQLEPGKTYSIGRHSGSDICLPFTNISKNQATLYFVSPDKINIVDEGSSNGTFVGDETHRITGSRSLAIGGKIRLCKRDPIVLKLTGA